MVDTMRAERFYAESKTIAVEDVPIPEPGPGEVLVKVAFCGICHSDLSLINGTFPSQRPVVTQGHEASGTIAKLGPDVTGWAEGDRVIVAAGRPCMTCPRHREAGPPGGQPDPDPGQAVTRASSTLARPCR
jgi:D-arabinose 1-dehydrogenase-like Zn-dependent alcohol dehydrogenase